jgi:hypothetical protein
VLNKHYAVKAYGGSVCIAPYFLDFGTRWRWMVSFTLRLLYPWERTLGVHWIGGWVDPRAGLDDAEKKKFFTLPGLELRPLGRPAAIQATLSWLPGKVSRKKRDVLSVYLLAFSTSCTIPRNERPLFAARPRTRGHEVQSGWLNMSHHVNPWLLGAVQPALEPSGRYCMCMCVCEVDTWCMVTHGKILTQSWASRKCCMFI